MDKQLANYFFEQTAESLGFLVEEYGFIGPQLEIDEKVNFAFVTFMGKNVAIECSLDEREGDLACIIARVINGKRATYYDAVDERNEQGIRVREHLTSFLRRLGVREALFTKVGSLEFHHQVRVTLGDFAQMLRKHGQEILSDSSTALD